MIFFENPVTMEPAVEEDTAIPQGQGEKVPGDAVQSGTEILADNPRRVKTFAYKKRKNPGNKGASVGQAPKRMRRKEIGQYLRDMIDEAGVMYADPDFSIPNHLGHTGTASTRGPLPETLTISNDSAFGGPDRERGDPGHTMSRSLGETAATHSESQSSIPPRVESDFPEKVEVPSPCRAIPWANPLKSSTDETLTRKFPIKSLKDGLSGCPLEALQSLISNNFRMFSFIIRFSMS